MNMLAFPSRTLLPALLSACLFFCGCAPQIVESGSGFEEYTPSIEDPTPEPVPTPRSGNPVWLFYQDFYDAAQAPLDALHEAMAQSDAPEALEGELLLSAFEDRLTEGMVSFGLLMSADTENFLPGGSYASYVEGAALGNGTITPAGSGASLSFTYTDGTTLTGSLTDYRLRYTRQEAGQAPSYSLLLLRSPSGWAALLDLGGGPAYVLRSSPMETGLYAIGYSDQPDAALPVPTPKLSTYGNAIDGAVQSWVWSGNSLSISGLES